MILALVAQCVLAAPVDRGLQARIHPAGFDFVSAELTDTTFTFGPDRLVGSWECYDELAVDDFNLSLQLGQVRLEPLEGGIGLDVTLGEVRGEDMVLHGVSGWFDLCVDFDADLEYIALNEGHIQGELSASQQGGALALDFDVAPVVSGELDSQIHWFPDGLAWAFMEQTLLDTAGALIESELPPVVAALTADGLLLGTFGDIPVTVFVDEVRAGADGLFAALDVDLAGDGGAAGAALDLSARGDAHLAVGLTEVLAQEVLEVASGDGWLSTDSETTAALLGDLLAGLGLDDGVDVSLRVESAPGVVVDEDGIRVSLPATTLVADKAGEPLLELVGDLDGRLEVRVAHGGITLTAHELNLDVHTLEASHLVDGDPDHLRDFLEGWVMEAATASLADLEVYGAHFEALGYVLRLDETESQRGGFVAWCTLFAADDPAVDRTAPDTTVEATLGSGTLEASFAGTDDRPGELVYSYRVDDGSWSRWSPDPNAVVALEPGAHTVEVRARDGWHNEDPTPATAAITVPSPASSEERGCGCDTGRASTAWMAGLFVLLSLRRASSPRPFRS